MKEEASVGTPTRDEAMRALHRDYAVLLTRFVLRLTREGTVAEDVVAETLLRAWANQEVLQRPEGALRAGLFTVARNLVIDDWRSARHRLELARADLPERGTPDQTDRILDAWLIADAMESLSPEHREVITRAYFGGQDTASIAEDLGVPPGTVKSRLHYGLLALKLALQENGVSRP